MASLSDHYPISCPFCNISNAYPAGPSPVPSDPNPELVSPQCHLLLSSKYVLAFLDILPISPGHVLITTRDHYTKLSDIQGKSNGADDWASRRAAETAKETSRAIGEWLPIVSRALCRATGIEDWNVVQNNGERAAQVVPHVHFHLIPRFQEGRTDKLANRGKKEDVGMLKSWRMFGKGSREELDDDEGAELAAMLRDALAEEVGDPQPKQKL